MSSVSDIVAEMRGEYLEDCARRLAELQSLFEGLDSRSAEILRQIETHAHAIKGSAFSFGLPHMSLLCGVWEGEMKRARVEASASKDDVAAWLTYCNILDAMVEYRSVTQDSAGASVMIWTPFEASREKLAATFGERFSVSASATTDRNALERAAHESPSAILTTLETDSELTLDQRIDLLSSVAVGINAALLIADVSPDQASMIEGRGLS